MTPPDLLPHERVRAGEPLARRAISVTGVVQGVGFRPFVHELARELGVGGFVKNGAGGVLIEAEGPAPVLEQFVAALEARRPPQARIETVHTRACAPRGEEEFRIEPSEWAAPGHVAVSADLATCDECVRELFDPRGRRYRYPFTTCAHCGPRLTIALATPWDRDRTTMAAFSMCAACRREYEDPRDRRFHAQTIACPACGPRLRALDRHGAAVEDDDPLALAVRALHRGQVLAIKGIGGYHLACDAANPAAVGLLRSRKARDSKPFAIMVRDLAAAEALGEVSPVACRLLTSAARPIVLVRRRPGAAIAAAVAPDLDLVGVMLPYTPLHWLLLHGMPGRALVMTSGNRSDDPIVYEDDDARARLAGVADLVLAHDRAIHVRCDDSVIRVAAGEVLPVRRARGEVPGGIPLPAPLARPTLALGGHLKAAVAFGDGRRALPSQHLGDLDGYEPYRAYIASIEHYERVLGVAPRRLVHDGHPDYASTQYAIERARETGVELLAVQHHHAHMASCMAEHGLTGTVVGVCFDGAGWGGDGTVWGGELLLGDARAFRRVAHLRHVPMPGGEAAVREPWRMAVAYLREAGEPVDASTLGRRLDRAALRVVDRMLERGFNAPATSSAGRLFDAVAALIGACDRMSYEGQAAMRLESLATGTPAAGAYPFEVLADRAPLVVDPRPLIRAVVTEARRGVPGPIIARRFHSTLVDVVEAVCRRLRDASGVDTVVLSGGVFLNAILAAEVPERLAGTGFRTYRHRLVPSNDGGLCLGQLAIAAARDAAVGSA